MLEPELVQEQRWRALLEPKPWLFDRFVSMPEPQSASRGLGPTASLRLGQRATEELFEPPARLLGFSPKFGLQAMSQDSGIRTLERAARRAARRLRLRAAIGRGALLLPIPLTYAVVVLSAIKALRLSLETQGGLLLGATIPVGVFVIGTLHAAFRPRSPWLGSLALDGWHKLDDRVTNALAFVRLPAAERTPL